MKAYELIKELIKYDEDSEVLITSENEDLYKLESVDFTNIAGKELPTLWINK